MNVFKKLAVLVVTAYAKHIFKEAVEKAEEKRKRTGCTIFVISNQFNVKGKLLVLTYKEYCDIRDYVVGAPRIKYSFVRLKESCWYHTSDKYGANGLDAHSLEIRKRAFIKDCLLKANLVTK